MSIKKYFTEEEKKSAQSKNHKKYYQNHKDAMGAYQKEYLKNNKEKMKKWNREYQKDYQKLKRKTDINFKILCGLRERLNKAIHNNQKLGSAVKDLGCSVPELKIYLESKFQEGMSWDNWGQTGWHIDHIKPLSSFNLQDRDEFLKANHYTNLQPLWAEENRKKSNHFCFSHK